MTVIANAVFVKSSNPWLNCLRSTTRGVCGRLAALPDCAAPGLGKTRRWQRNRPALWPEKGLCGCPVKP